MSHHIAQTKTTFVSSRSAAILAVIGANVALAFGPLFVRSADVGPVAVGFWRIALATPLLLALAWRRDGNLFHAARGWWGLFLLAGVAFAADLASWHIGILRTSFANSTLFGNTAVLIFPIYGFIAARLRPSRTQMLALLLALLGGGLLLGRSAELSPRYLTGDIFCMAAGVFYSGFFILMQRVRTQMPPLPALALSSLASVLPMLLLSLLLGERLWPHLWWPLLGVALVSQWIGQGLILYALGHLPPLVIGIALLIQPMVAGALGWVLYDERLAGPDLIGAAMVAIALVLVREGPVEPDQLASAPDETKPEQSGETTP